MPVVVVTDSSSRLPASLAERFGVLQVPLHLRMPDGRDFREDVDTVPSTIVSVPNVTTSGANLADLKQAYERALELSEGAGAVAVHMSRRLSGTWSAARLAAEELDDQVRVVDSRSVGISLGMTVIGAAQQAARGGDRDSVYESAITVAARGESLMCLQTLENLRASGRISAASRMLGSALAIKPILEIADGVLSLRERHRTFSKALGKMVDAAVELAGDEPVVVGVQHCRAEDGADELLETLRERIPQVTSMLVSDLGPVLGTHVGPGAVGVSLARGLDPFEF